MTSKTVLQPFCSRPHSLKNQASKLSWLRGVSNFFLEDIPFSYTAGPKYADALCQMMATFFKAHTPSTFHIVDVGAGIGWQAQQVLLCLKSQHPDLYAVTVYHVCEYEQSLLTTLKQAPHLSEFQDKLAFDLLDVHSLPDAFGSPIHCVIMSYLMDSLDAHHISVKEGELYETLVQTSADTMTPFVKQGSFPPEVIANDDLKSIMTSLSEKTLPYLSALSDRYDETYQDIPLSESTLAKKHQDFLTDYIASEPCKESFIFNISPLTHQLMEWFITQTTNPTLILCFDFGDITAAPGLEIGHLIGKFRAAQFMTIHFPLLSHHFKTNDWHEATSSFRNGTSQYAYYTNTPSTELQLTFDTYMGSPEDSQDNNPSHLMEKALTYFKSNQLSEAKDIALNIQSIWGKDHLSSLHLLSEIYLEEKNYHQCCDLLESLIEKHPHYFGFHFVLSQAYAQRDYADAYIQHTQLFIQKAPHHIIWNPLLTLLKVYNFTEKNQEAVSIKTWMKTISNRFPSLIPEAIRKDAIL